MHYVIIRNQQGAVIGFMVDDDEIPVMFKTEEQAENAIKGHIAEHFMEIIEL